VTSQGHPYGIFQRAVKRRDLLGAVAAAKELPPFSLTDALELTILVARKDPRGHPRVAARWLLRYLEECDDATIDEPRWPPPASPRSPETATRTLRCRCGPWPKERLADVPTQVVNG
jgi:hypothetical protein